MESERRTETAPAALGAQWSALCQLLFDVGAARQATAAAAFRGAYQKPPEPKGVEPQLPVRVAGYWFIYTFLFLLLFCGSSLALQVIFMHFHFFAKHT